MEKRLGFLLVIAAPLGCVAACNLNPQGEDPSSGQGLSPAAQAGDPMVDDTVGLGGATSATGGDTATSAGGTGGAAAGGAAVGADAGVTQPAEDAGRGADAGVDASAGEAGFE